jgi:hypothetical protein
LRVCHRHPGRPRCLEHFFSGFDPVIGQCPYSLRKTEHFFQERSRKITTTRDILPVYSLNSIREVVMAKQPDKMARAVGAGLASFVGVLLGGLPGALVGAAIGHWATGEASKHGL